MTDEEALAAHGVDREALMVRVVQVYAQQLFVDGFFNADPHARQPDGPGARRRRRAAREDDGAAVGAAAPRYARLALSAQQMDLCEHHRRPSARSASRRSRRCSDPARDLEFWRFFLRDTGTRDEARKQSSDFFKTRRRSASRTSARGARAAARRDPARPHLLLAGDRAAPRAVHPAAPRPRAVHGAARRARALASRRSRRRRSARSRSRRPPSGPHAAAVHAKLAARSSPPSIRGRRRRRRPGVRPARRQHARRGGGGRFRGQVDARPVEASTPMPLRARARCPPRRPRGARARQARRPQVRPDAASLWPAFGQNGTAGVTVRQALTHRVALRHAVRRAEGSARRASSPTSARASPRWRRRRSPTARAARRRGRAASGLVHGAGARRPICEGAMGAPYCQRRPMRCWSTRTASPASCGRASPRARTQTTPRRCRPRLRGGLATALPSGGGGTPGGGRGRDAGSGGGVAGAQRPQWPRWREGDARHAGDASVADQGVAAAKAFEHELPMNAGMVNAPEVRGAADRRVLLRRLWLGALARALLGAAARGDLAPAGALDSADGGDRGVGALRRAAVGPPRGSGTRAPAAASARWWGCTRLAARWPSAPREKVAVALLMNDCQLEYDDAPRAEPDLEGAAHREGRVRGGRRSRRAAWARASM